MAHHYPPHTQAQAQAQTVPQSYPYPTGSYGYPAGYYAGFPGVPGYPFDPAAVGASAHVPTAPEIPGVSAQLASHVIQRLISTEMRDVGFEAAESGAMRRLELEVAACK